MNARLPDGPFVVAIDGPAGSGKSTLAKKIAAAVDGVVIDTGAMYRSVTLTAQEAGVDLTDAEAVSRLARAVAIRFEPDAHGGQKVFIDDVDRSADIRTPAVNAAVSTVSAHAGVRERLVELQRFMGRHGRVVMEGRDIGSHVFPDARFKFFLVADDRERARRRLIEMRQAGRTDVTLEAILANLRERDRLDSSRTASPLIKAPDAVEIDTTRLGIDEVLNKMLSCLFS
jgi:cytidylate kinase